MRSKPREKELIMLEVKTMMEEMVRSRKATRISSIQETNNIQSIGVIPEPNVSGRAMCRRFTAELKFHIPKEVESSKEKERLVFCYARQAFVTPFSYMETDVRCSVTPDLLM